jgi:hypothetical protein
LTATFAVAISFFRLDSPTSIIPWTSRSIIYQRSSAGRQRRGRSGRGWTCSSVCTQHGGQCSREAGPTLEAGRQGSRPGPKKLGGPTSDMDTYAIYIRNIYTARCGPKDPRRIPLRCLGAINGPGPFSSNVSQRCFCDSGFSVRSQRVGSPDAPSRTVFLHGFSVAFFFLPYFVSFFFPTIFFPNFWIFFVFVSVFCSG